MHIGFQQVLLLSYRCKQLEADGDATRSSKREGNKLGFRELVHVGIRVYRQPQCEGMKICTMEGGINVHCLPDFSKFKPPSL
jgi:hypothetical protein